MSTEGPEGYRWGMPAAVTIEPGTAEGELARVDGATSTVIVAARLGPAEAALVDAVVGRRPDLWLMAAADEAFPHLEFLGDTPHVSRLDVRCAILSDLEGLRHVAGSLTRLHLGRTQWPRTSLSGIRHAVRVDHVSLDGWSRDLDVIADHRHLRHLVLRGTRGRLPQGLAGLPQLGVFEWSLGRTADVSDLAGMHQLQHLALRDGSALRNTDVVSGLTGLRSLTLTSLTNVRSLPDLSRLESLEVIRISNCRVLKDLTPLRTAPGLRSVTITRMPHLTVDDLALLADHPNAPLLRVRLGTRERTAEVLTALGDQSLAEGRSADLPDLPRLPQGCWALPPPGAGDCADQARRGPAPAVDR